MSRYGRMGKAEKVAYHLERQPARTGPVVCPACQTRVLEAQLEQHGTRCPGAILAKPWLLWSEVLGLEVSRSTLALWCASGRVRRRRTDEGRGPWEYAQVDIRLAIERCMNWHKARRARRIAHGSGRRQ